MTANWPMPPVSSGSRRTAARVTLGAICFWELQPFPTQIVLERHKARGVAPWLRQTFDEAGANRISDVHEHNRHGSCRLQQRRYARGAGSQDDVWGKSDNFRRVPTSGIEAAETRAEIDLHVSANGPAHLLELLDECGVSLLSTRIVPGAAREHSNPPHPLALLRARRERPRSRCAAEQRG